MTTIGELTAFSAWTDATKIEGEQGGASGYGTCAQLVTYLASSNYVVNPSTDNAIPRFNGLVGKLQGSGVIIDDNNNLTVPASIFVTERAAAAADVEGDLQLWAKNGTPNTLWLTDDAGTNFQVATLAGTETLTNKTLTSPTINTPALGADSIDAITEIAAALKSGSDGKLITGTAGTSGNFAEWNGDGDVVDSGFDDADFAKLASANVFTSTTQTFRSSAGFQPQLIAHNTAEDANAGYFIVQKSRGYDQTSSDAVQVNDTLGTFIFRGADSNGTFKNAAYIASAVESVSAGAVAARYSFVAGTSFVCRFDSSGNIVMGNGGPPASAAGVFVMVNGTAPTGNVTNGISLYAEDVSASSELKVRDEGGTITTLSPHNFSMFDPDPNEPLPWSYYSRNEHIGKEIGVDMARAIRAIERLSGETFIYYRDIPAVDVDAANIESARVATEGAAESARHAWENEVLDAMQEEIEIPKRDALETVSVMKMEATDAERTVYGIDPDTGKIKTVKEPVVNVIDTGKTQHRIKSGVRLDPETGKFKRLRTRTEAESVVGALVLPEPVAPKEPPKWVRDRLPKKSAAK